MSEWPQYYRQTQISNSNTNSMNMMMTSSPSSSSSSLSHPDPQGNLSPEGRVTKPVRRRSRASRRTPTTLLNTDTANFRAMVQQFTGGPANTATFPAFSVQPTFSLGFTNNNNNYNNSGPAAYNNHLQQQQLPPAAYNNMISMNNNNSRNPTGSLFLQRLGNSRSADGLAMATENHHQQVLADHTAATRGAAASSSASDENRGNPNTTFMF